MNALLLRNPNLKLESTVMELVKDPQGRGSLTPCMMFRKSGGTALGGLFLMVAFWFPLIMFTASVAFGDDIVLGRVVPKSEQVARSEIDHSSWDRLLKTHVDSRGFVAYQSWKSSETELVALDTYINDLSRARIAPTDDKAVQLAFWINAYNAVTVRGILREYPTTSIRNHTAKLWGYNIWKNLKLQVDGRQFSLDDMEHQVLRKLGEPRIHFAVVCASIGCPRLLNEAYRPMQIDEQLTRNAVDFFANPIKFSSDVKRKKLSLSPLLDWYKEDFGKDQTSRLDRLRSFMPIAAQSLAVDPRVTVRYLDYDWGLNDQKATSPGSR